MAVVADKIEEPPGGRLLGFSAPPTNHALIRQYIVQLEKNQDKPQLQSLFYWNLAGEFAAVMGSLAAGAASTSYFWMLRENPIWEAGEFLLPAIIWGIVSAASWYMYRLDVVESFLSHRVKSKEIESESCDMKKGFCVPIIMLTVLLIVSMDLALSGYGVFEVLEGQGDFQIAAVAFVCVAALLAESAQQYKYIKDIFDWEKLKAMIKPPDVSQGKYIAYTACSFFAMIFYSMSIFEMLEVMGDPAAIALVSTYVLFSMPYYSNKAADQVRSEQKPTTIIFSRFNAARAGNMLGDIGFSLYGYFETMHALDLVEHPTDIFNEDNIPKTAGLLILGFCVVVATCVSSYTLTAEGNNDGHFNTLKKHWKR